MGVHPKRHGLVAVSHGLRHAGDVRSIGDCDAGKTVPEDVRVKIGNSTPFRKPFEVACGALGVHRLRAVLLREHPLADSGLGLLKTEPPQEGQRVVPDINYKNPKILDYIKSWIFAGK